MKWYTVHKDVENTAQCRKCKEHHALIYFMNVFRCPTCKFEGVDYEQKTFDLLDKIDSQILSINQQLKAV